MRWCQQLSITSRLSVCSVRQRPAHTMHLVQIPSVLQKSWTRCAKLYCQDAPLLLSGSLSEKPRGLLPKLREKEMQTCRLSLPPPLRFISGQKSPRFIGAAFGPAPSPWFPRFAWLSRRQQPAPPPPPSPPPTAPKCVSVHSSSSSSYTRCLPFDTSVRLPQHTVSLRTH